MREQRRKMHKKTLHFPSNPKTKNYFKSHCQIRHGNWHHADSQDSIITGASNTHPTYRSDSVFAPLLILDEVIQTEAAALESMDELNARGEQISSVTASHLCIVVPGRNGRNEFSRNIGLCGKLAKGRICYNFRSGVRFRGSLIMSKSS